MTPEQMVCAKEIGRKAFNNLRFSPDEFTEAKNELLSIILAKEKADADSVLSLISDGLDCAKAKGLKPDFAAFVAAVEKLNRYKHVKVIFSIHGIRTDGPWQKTLTDLINRKYWQCPLNKWSYGRFGILWFLFRPTREAKVEWLRKLYDQEIHNPDLDLSAEQLPSIVAHSFGTYILGYTLLRYDFIRFDKIILCGSILPREFPWDRIIARGQVQAVRNEFGMRDTWVKCVRGYVGGTGPSGSLGFTCLHERFTQEQFDYDHGEYFGRDHMSDRWIPFLETALPTLPKITTQLIPRPRTNPPWGIYFAVSSIIILLLVVFFVHSSLGLESTCGLACTISTVVVIVGINIALWIAYMSKGSRSH